MNNKKQNRQIFFYLFLLCLNLLMAENMALQANDSLTLEAAIAMALDANPEIHQAKADQEEIQYIGKIESLAPNPGLSIGADEFAGTGSFSGTSALKSSFGISQTIITGNKIPLKKRLARASDKAAAHRTQQIFRQVKVDAGKAFLEIIFAEQMVEIASEALAIASENARIVSRRVSAGEIPQIDETRTRVDFSAAELLLKKEQRNLKTSRINLAGIWNSEKLDFDSVRINSEPFLKYAEVIESKPADTLNNPEIESAKADVTAAEIETAIAKSKRIPNISLSGKLNKFRSSGEHAYSIELEFELPSRAGIKAEKRLAKARLRKAQAIKNDVFTRVQNELKILRQTISSLHADYLHTRDILLPAAKQAYEETRRAFSAGEKNLTDLFDARKTLLEVKRISSSIANELNQKVLEYAIADGNENSLIKSVSNEKEEAR